MPNPIRHTSDPSSHVYQIVRGEEVRWAAHDPRPCQVPPDCSGGYSSIYAAQSGEDTADAAAMQGLVVAGVSACRFDVVGRDIIFTDEVGA